MLQDATPGMVVQKLEGKVKRPTRRYVLDKDLSTPENKRYKMVDGEETVDAGYLVLFPIKGHSIRVDEAEMLRLREKFENARGSVVEAENAGAADMTHILRSAGGSSLVTVIQEGAK